MGNERDSSQSLLESQILSVSNWMDVVLKERDSYQPPLRSQTLSVCDSTGYRREKTNSVWNSICCVKRKNQALLEP